VSAFVGISGAKRNAAAAACVDGQIRAVCEQERLTRIRAVGVATGTLPVEAVDQVTALSNCQRDDITAFVVAEPELKVPAKLPSIRIDHHEAHAATAFLTSPFERAAVIVCDSHSKRELSVWVGDPSGLRDLEWPWNSRALASLYSECADLSDQSGLAPAVELEALAHLGRGERAHEVGEMFRLVDGRLETVSAWREKLGRLIDDERRRHGEPVEVAYAIQHRIGELLLELLAMVRNAVDTDALCLGGGLFCNTYLTTLVQRARLFADVFVPINPGNAGLGVGAALLAGRSDSCAQRAATLSPFLGPEYDLEAIKATLDSCKLSYDFVSQNDAEDLAVDALVRGKLVAWFQGRMEWGPRALGHRSILANPRSPHVLDNLNVFLRKRPRSRPFGVSVCADTVPHLFCGPAESPFMQYEYTPRDDRLRHVMPQGASTVRVQTVAPPMGPFWALLKKMEQATGTAAVVNTSFNGFQEPIVCSPRDAVRVFFGTGLDTLIIGGRFVLTK
jgi:carbamoyltransferase